MKETDNMDNENNSPLNGSKSSEELIQQNNNPSDETEISEEDKGHKFLNRRSLLMGAVTVGVMAVSYPLMNYALDEYDNKKAKDQLNGIKSLRGEVFAMNTEKVVFEGQRAEVASSDQKALATPGGSHENSAVWSFSNKKENENRKIVDLFLDFNSPLSRDMLLINAGMLNGMVSNATIDLNVHPLPSGEILSMYSYTALCETFVTSPSLGWDAMLEMAKVNAEKKDERTREEFANMVVKKLTDLGVEKVYNDLIYLGEFTSWIIASGNNDMVKNAATSAPILYVNGTMINLNNINANNTEEVRKSIIEQ